MCILFSHRGEKHNKLSLQVRTSSSDGLLVFASQGATLGGDFLALALSDGVPQVTFRLGKGQEPVTVRAEVNAVKLYLGNALFVKRTLSK